MPQQDDIAKAGAVKTGAAHAWVAVVRRPWVFGLVVMLAYLALVAPMLVRHHFDTSVFVLAGDRFVDAGLTPSPIIVARHSDGYDGQFYYRLALAPLLTETRAFGVTLDHPAWRAQRILLPLVAHGLALGQARFVPAALFAINLAGLFAIGFLAMRMAAARAWPMVVPVAIVAWPGLLAALTRDTTEILAGALLLAGMSAWLERRVVVCAVMLGLAALTRETSVLVTGGLLAAAVWRCWRPGAAARPWREVGWLGAALVPFLAWRAVVGWLWRESPQAHGMAHNVGWPLVGLAEAVLSAVLGHAVGDGRAPRDLVARAAALLGIGVITWFCARIVPVAVRLLRGGSAAAGLAAGWVLVLGLMSVLTAGGPWVEPTAYFRAFTECWVVGWCLVGVAGNRPSGLWWLAAAGVPLFVRNVELWCLR
jgi:fluoride ion exporter CrcB/FEX